MLQGLSNILKKGEGPNRMEVFLRGYVCEQNREEPMGMGRSANIRLIQGSLLPYSGIKGRGVHT